MAEVRIVVGVDGSDSALIAARTAARFAQALGAELRAVHVAQVAGTVVAAMGSFPVPVPEITSAEREAVWSRVGRVLDESPVDVERVDLEGYPPDALVEYAAESDADLLVVGSRGRGDLASLVLGSVSHRVVNHAPCNVLVARKETS